MTTAAASAISGVQGPIRSQLRASNHNALHRGHRLLRPARHASRSENRYQPGAEGGQHAHQQPLRADIDLRKIA
ncbi:hypothetical protein L2218_05615, partial [Xanthomonas perforans]|nr:hypothetical protein [Xanthomonas perforans]